MSSTALTVTLLAVIFHEQARLRPRDGEIATSCRFYDSILPPRLPRAGRHGLVTLLSLKLNYILSIPLRLLELGIKVCFNTPKKAICFTTWF